MDELQELHFFFDVIDNVAHPIFVKDRSFRWVFLNRAFCDLIGRPREELIGKTDYDFVPKEEADFFRKKDVEMFTTRMRVQIDEEAFTDAKGGRHVLATTKVPLLDASGEVTHLVGIIHDITRMKDAEEQLRVTNQELERRVKERTEELQKAQLDLMRKERLTELGKLAGGVAHEIRNPLSAINNAAYLLARHFGKGAPRDVADTLGIIHEEVRRANHIVAELLDYARVREPDRKLVSVGALVDGALKTADLPPRIELHAERPENGLTVFVDATQCEAALANVIRNSVEAMHGIGRLWLDVVGDDDKVTVRVRDEGPGISKEVATRLFEPLVTTKASGLGLGLVTARRLVEGQGGTLENVPSENGACFALALPRRAA